MDIKELRDLFVKGKKPKFLFFWGPNDKDSRKFLNQWNSSSFSIDNISYPTAEHYMMATKARVFEDTDTLNQILKTKSPKEAKDLGRKVKNFDQKVWEDNRFRIVVEGNVAKFSQNKEMGDYLISTSNKILVEASPYDKIWGIGLKETHEHVKNPLLWPGLNLLGFALMETRKILNE